ncbi:relaxase domain-containing protein [Streptomyces sp. NPDC006703]|uniref:relaxase domain-containing protein n=1 Tax=Streptomyces sp. NPDC006703 TaxID=3364759 RepID=UPI0036BEAF81
MRRAENAQVAKTERDIPIEGLQSKWGALDTRRLYRHVVAAGTLYTLAMTTEVCEKPGLATVPREVTPGLRPVMEIAGVDSELIDWSSTRRQRIEDVLECLTSPSGGRDSRCDAGGVELTRWEWSPLRSAPGGSGPHSRPLHRMSVQRVTEHPVRCTRCGLLDQVYRRIPPPLSGGKQPLSSYEFPRVLRRFPLTACADISPGAAPTESSMHGGGGEICPSRHTVHCHRP